MRSQKDIDNERMIAALKGYGDLGIEFLRCWWFLGPTSYQCKKEMTEYRMYQGGGLLPEYKDPNYLSEPQLYKLNDKSDMFHGFLFSTEVLTTGQLQYIIDKRARGKNRK